MSAPVLIPINRRRSATIGIGCAGLGLVTLGIMALIAISDSRNGSVLVIGVLSAGVFLWLGVHFIGIAYRNPVALRMDAHGISGFYATPALWSEIKSIRHESRRYDHSTLAAALSRNSIDVQQLGFELNDPVGFRDRQTPWQRLSSWSNGRAVGLHIIIPEGVLKDTKVADLLPIAQTLYAEAHANTTS